jgi:acyl-CoA thioesterase-1
MIGCGDTGRNQSEAGAVVHAEANSTASSEPGSTGEVDATRSGAEDRVVLFLGTSLTAGYGLPVEQSFPTMIQEKIDSADLPFRAVNAGVSGETSAGALRRIDWLLQQPFDVLVLETGSNDMLRGTAPAETERNIQAIVDRVRERRPDARILLVGMLAAPNLGPEYVEQFEGIYPRIAERNRLTLLPFLLEGVAAVRDLNQTDGIHPNAQGHRIVAETVWRTLEPVLREEVMTGGG